jgi:hypothetical protein
VCIATYFSTKQHHKEWQSKRDDVAHTKNEGLPKQRLKIPFD